MKVFLKLKGTLESLGRILVKALLFPIPRNRHLVVFGAWAGTRYDDNARVLFEHCLATRPDCRCVWHTRSRSVKDQLDRMGLPVALVDSFRGWWDICRAKYIIHTDSPRDYGWPLFSGGATIVNLWHGVGPKRFGKDISKTPTAFGHFLEKAERALVRQYYVSTSDAITDRYVRVFETDKSHILCLGQARNDVFFTPHENPLRTRFPGRRIVAYLPTFREDGNGPMPMDLDRLLDLPALEAVCQQYGLVFLVKFHQWTPGHLSDGFEHIIQLKDNSLHVQMLLDAADILITDYSSCFVDQLLLDRPQILFAYDLDHYMTHERNLYGDFRADATGRLCEDNAALLDELEKLAQGKDAYAGKRHRIRDFYYNPENQCSVAAKQVEKILSIR